MSYKEPSKEAIREMSTPEYYQPKTLEGYIDRYRLQIKHGYDGLGYCQGLIDLLEELKTLRKEKENANALNS